MAKELRVTFPDLSPAQIEILDGASRFNVVAGGHDAGLTTLAIDVLLASTYGAIHGFPVGFFTPDDESLLKVRRRVFSLIQPLLLGRLDRSRVDLVGGGSIHFHTLSSGSAEIWDQLSLIVVDDAARVDGLVDTWEDVLRPLLARYRGHAWFFSRPRGMRNGFYKLFLRGGVEPDWEAFTLPATANPYANADLLERDRREMAEEVFQQERLGRFIDSPVELTAGQTIIGKDETFRQWCTRLAADGLKVDGVPFTVDDRPSMHFIYDLIPSTKEEAFERVVVLMKCAQVGFTVMEILAMIYIAIKFMPAKIGMYLPDMNLARIKSSERFMPIVRTIPAAHKLMLDGGSSEGNVMIRNMAGSRFYFLWTSGKGATESVPLDVLALDEVQEMEVADMEKVQERLSASKIKFILAGSTANVLDRDIHFLYKQGTRHQHWSRCEHCGESHVLDEYFPECIKFNHAVKDYGYVCKSCGGFLADPQVGEWRPQDPQARKISAHYPQFLSPTITARNIIEAYYNADDMKNFYNRKLGKPYSDPSQVPINLEMLQQCADLGMKLGVRWKERAADTYMGIDQMGAFNVVIVCERLSSGHMAVIHVEEIYSTDPFERCSEILVNYGVRCCVVETLPNYNDAKRFANRHPGIVFLAGYTDMKDDMLRWGDAVPSSAERKTDEEDRDRYTVTLDQYKCMQVALARIQKAVCVFPDPDALVQEVCEKGTKGSKVMMKLLRERVFMHFTRTALIAEKDDEQNKYRRRVVKVGIDPHFSYAYMLMNVAWARAFGTTSFIFTDAGGLDDAEVAVEAVTQSPVVQVMREHNRSLVSRATCGRCSSFEDNYCTLRDFGVREEDLACPMYDGYGEDSD